MTTKLHTSTVAGQKELCQDAGNRAVVTMLNEKVRKFNPALAWDAGTIASADADFLKTIRDDLIPIYNESVQKFPTLS